MHLKCSISARRVAGGYIVRAVAVAVACLVSGGPAPAETKPKVKIAFLGDSVAGGYWEGVTRLVALNACLRTHLEVVNFTKVNTGLTRGRHVDWAAEVRRIGSRFKPQLFVISVGTNDLDSDDTYNDRITAVLRSAVASNAGMLWVGLPAMRERTFDRNGREKNKLFEQAIGAFEVKDIQYIQPWKLHATDVDKFASYGPDEHGRMTHLRASDGTHFTAAGNLMVGAYLLSKISGRLADANLNSCAKSEANVR